MRIAYFTDTYLPQINGQTNTLRELDDYLLKKNISHVFFAPKYPDAASYLSENNVRRFNSISLPFYRECRISIPLYRYLCKKVDAFSPDIIHLATPLGIGLKGLKYARERKIPIVSSFHTNFDVYLKYYKLQYLEDMVWKFFKWFHNFCEINFCPSMHTLETLDKNGIKHLKIWSRGIDTKKFSPRHRDPMIRRQLNAGSKVLFLYVGRLAPEKDLDILIESINKINVLYPCEAHFVIVGDGPYAQKMREVLPENVTFTGYLKGLELSKIYASCDVFVFPSSTETFGNVVLEAMASGLPAVSVEAGGVKESIIHAYNGLLCQPRSTDSFTHAISLFLNNRNLIYELGINARKYSMTKSWNLIFGQLVSDYNAILNNKKPDIIGKLA